MTFTTKQNSEKRKFSKRRRNEEICGSIMGLIPVVGCLMFVLVPMVLALVMAFFNMRHMVDFEGATFVGFENFVIVFKDANFVTAILNTLIYAITLPISIVLALVIGSVINADIPGKGFFRVVIFLPYICSTVAIVYIWKWLFNTNYGILNVLLGTKVGWLDSPGMYRLSLIIMMVWAQTGYKVVLVSAALTAVNRSYYEAAEIDGATVLDKFFHITLPAISPTIFFLLIMGLISIFQMFSESQVLDPTGGQAVDYAGLTMVFYLYRQGFSYTRMGAASAAAWVLTLIIMLITVLNFKLSKLWVKYDD